MHKKILLIAVVVFCVVISSLAIFLFSQGYYKQTQIPAIEQITITPTVNPYKETFEGFRLYWIEVRDINKISLFSNLKDKKSSISTFEELSCKYLVSAGFYNKNDEHIGLFATDGKIISESISDNFFDGYFYIQSSVAKIALKNPQLPYIGVQSGPVIMLNNKFLIKNYANDDYSRRILVGITRSASVVFMAIYGDNKITGPRLADIEKIVTELEEKSQIDIVDLINLDGGSHSAFITDDLKISEISIIGGYFCIRR